MTFSEKMIKKREERKKENSPEKKFEKMMQNYIDAMDEDIKFLDREWEKAHPNYWNENDF